MTNPEKLVIIPKQRVAGNMFGREDAISRLRCISESAGGCEREISEAEYRQWDTDTKAEYGQSGWCRACQDKIFTDPEDTRPHCSCDSIDVGLPVMMPIEDPHCQVHADPDVLRITFDSYDPDMREDEPPADMHMIEWTRVV